MAKINILDSGVYNRIAAGEVVDRPYSVVKEFVENSLDAGAKNITVTIERGGKDLISVSDDGSGIEKDDLRAAFMPHATSKIAKAEDLEIYIRLDFAVRRWRVLRLSAMQQFVPVLRGRVKRMN